MAKPKPLSAEENRTVVNELIQLGNRVGILADTLEKAYGAKLFHKAAKIYRAMEKLENYVRDKQPRGDER